MGSRHSIRLTQLWLKRRSAWFNSDSTHISDFHGWLNSDSTHLSQSRVKFDSRLMSWAQPWWTYYFRCSIILPPVPPLPTEVPPPDKYRYTTRQDDSIRAFEVSQVTNTATPPDRTTRSGRLRWVKWQIPIHHQTGRLDQGVWGESSDKYRYTTRQDDSIRAFEVSQVTNTDTPPDRTTRSGRLRWVKWQIPLHHQTGRLDQGVWGESSDKYRYTTRQDDSIRAFEVSQVTNTDTPPDRTTRSGRLRWVKWQIPLHHQTGRLDQGVWGESSDKYRYTTRQDDSIRAFEVSQVTNTDTPPDRTTRSGRLRWVKWQIPIHHQTGRLDQGRLRWVKWTNTATPPDRTTRSGRLRWVKWQIPIHHQTGRLDQWPFS